jgi:hypothetical protein
MATVKVYRPRAVVDAPRTYQALLTFVLAVVEKMTGNPNFTSPGTLLTDLAAAAAAFGKAIVDKSQKRNVGDALTAAKQAMVDQVTHVKGYVNGVAGKLPVDQAKMVIESAGLRAKKVVVRVKPPLEAKYGGLEGTVLLVALAVAKRAMYSFQVSTDQTHWSACGNVMKSTTRVTGLTVGTTYYFRFQAQTHKGLGDWSMVVSFVVR